MPIKEQISKELGVPLQYINSALVSAQNRQRFYAHNIPNVPQPEDRGILLRDVLDGAVAEKQYQLSEPVNITADGKAQTLRATCYKDGIRNMVGNNVDRKTCVAEPVRIGTIENEAQNKDHDSKQYRVYSPDGKSTTICGQGGGVGAKTGLYAVPYEYIDYTPREKSHIVINENAIRCAQDKNNASAAESFVNFTDRKIGTVTTAHVPKCIEEAEKHPKAQPVYEVRNGLITIKDKQYPIKLADGYYIIRKLTVTECMRLQTVPDWYVFPVSNTQAYKMLGNGWTVEVIKHILSHIPSIQNEEIVVLSMYDGMSCGQIALKELGCNVIKYYATEIDKYAIKTTQYNFPDTIQLGDAFQVRDSLFAIEQNDAKSGIA